MKKKQQKITYKSIFRLQMNEVKWRKKKRNSLENQCFILLSSPDTPTRPIRIYSIHSIYLAIKREFSVLRRQRQNK